MNLIAKPAVRRVNRAVSMPRVAKPVTIRPSVQISSKIQKIQKPKPKKLVPQSVKQQQSPIYQRNSVSKKSSLASKPRAASPISHSRRQMIKKIKKEPKIIYRGRTELSEADKNKLKRIKDAGKGKVLIIVGNGPSILEADLKKLKNSPKIDIMSINKPDPRLFPTDYWLFCDNSQYNRNKDLWKGYSGIIFNTTAINNKKEKTYVVKNISGMGFSQDLLKGFHIGRSSVYTAMQVATWLNYEHIYIFGCDMTAKTVDGKELVHFYGVNPDVNPKNRVGRFDHEAKHYDHAASKLPSEVRKKYTFCSSYLKYKFADKFNKMDHTKAVDYILKHVNNLETKNGQKDS